MLVEVLLLKGASPSSAAITLEVLQTANRLRRAAGRPAPFEIYLTGSGARAASGFLGHPLRSCSTNRAGLVIVPGLAFTDEATVMQGLARRDVQAARTRLIEAGRGGAEIASSCSAVFLVAATGLLDGRRATTSWWLAPLFRRLFPAVALSSDDLVVTDAPFTTAGAAMAQLDLMLSLVTRHAGTRLAEQCARYMLLEQRTSQARFMAISFLAASDDRIRRAENWARRRLGESFSISDVAAAAGLAPRTFARRLERVTGLSPVRFVQRLRMERALELLETSRHSFEEIAWQVGYAEPSTLRRLLRRDADTGARKVRAAA